MRIRLAVPDAQVSPEVLNAALEAVTRTNEGLIASGSVPTWEEALRKGVRWKPEPPGDEHFDHARTVIARKAGDCDDLAPYAAATHRLTGSDPGARAIVIPTGKPGSWHAVVEHSDGSLSDPSASAGMHEWRKPVQPRLAGPHHIPHVTHARVNGGAFVARCDVPWHGTPLAISGHGYGESLPEALSDAIQGACMVGHHVAHPDHIARLEAADALLRGGDPEDVAEVLRARGQAHIVGSLFGSIWRGVKKAASTVVHKPGMLNAAWLTSAIAQKIPGVNALKAALEKTPYGQALHTWDLIAKAGAGHFGPDLAKHAHEFARQQGYQSPEHVNEADKIADFTDPHATRPVVVVRC